MPSLKRKNIPEIFEISDDDSDSPPVKKAKVTPDIIDIALAEDNVAPTPATKAKIAVSPPAAETQTQASIQVATPTPASRTVESLAEKKRNNSEVADRYVPKFDPVEKTEWRNPFKFSSKPPYWMKWSQAEYVNFVEELRSQFDPHPFSRLTGKPVEEILHVWFALVALPLYDTIEANKRGEEGMQQHFEALNKFGTPNRPWVGGKVHGELHNIKAGVVLLITQDEGNKEELNFADLSKADLKYLEMTLTDSDWKTLAGTDEVELK